jgi:hypothetical protein
MEYITITKYMLEVDNNYYSEHSRYLLNLNEDLYNETGNIDLIYSILKTNTSNNKRLIKLIGKDAIITYYKYLLFNNVSSKELFDLENNLGINPSVLFLDAILYKRFDFATDYLEYISNQEISFDILFTLDFLNKIRESTDIYFWALNSDEYLREEGLELLPLSIYIEPYAQLVSHGDIRTLIKTVEIYDVHNNDIFNIILYNKRGHIMLQYMLDKYGNSDIREHLDIEKLMSWSLAETSINGNPNLSKLFLHYNFNIKTEYFKYFGKHHISDRKEREGREEVKNTLKILNNMLMYNFKIPEIIVTNAAVSGFVEILEIIYPKYFTKSVYENAMIDAFENGQINILKWGKSKGLDVNRGIHLSLNNMKLNGYKGASVFNIYETDILYKYCEDLYEYKFISYDDFRILITI